MSFLDIIKTANQNLFRNKLRSFLTILAIFIGSFSIILNSAINTGVNSFIDNQVEAFGGEGYMDVMSSTVSETIASFMSSGNGPTEYAPEKGSDSFYITEEMVEEASKIPGVSNLSLSYSASAEYITSPDTDKKYTISINEMPSDTIKMDLVAGRSIDADTDQYEIAVTDGYVKALGYSSDEDAIGKTIILGVKNTATTKNIEVEATIVAVQAPSVISMGRSWISSALNTHLYDIINKDLPTTMTGMATSASAEYDTNMTADEIQTMKDRFVELGMTASTVDDQVGQVKSFFDVIIAVFTIFGAIALLAASIGIINTLFMSVQERTREIGLDKALGMSSGKVFLSFSVEAISLGFWGSILGIGVSVIAGFAANAIFHAPGGFLEAFPTFNLVEFTVPNCIIISAIIMLIAFLAGTLPARQAARKNPIDALRYE